MTHAPEEIKTMARLLCEAPEICKRAKNPTCAQCRKDGFRMLDALQAKGWKITDARATVAMVNAPAAISGTCQRTEMSDWACMHDAAPIVPRVEVSSSDGNPSEVFDYLATPHGGKR